MNTTSVETLMEDWISAIPPEEPEKREACRLKQEHTRHVAAIARQLAHMNPEMPDAAPLAEWIGWLHDLGRFEQFRQYGTFDDRISEDHSRLSLKAIRRYRLDRDLSPRERGWLWAAVLLHNRFQVPAHLPDATAFFVNLIRDADRLDIFRVFDHYYRKGPRSDSPLELGYPDTGIITERMAARIIRGESPSYEDACSVQEMRLIKLSWVYSFRTRGAHRLFLDSGILESTQAVLPRNPAADAVLQAVADFCFAHTADIK